MMEKEEKAKIRIMFDLFESYYKEIEEGNVQERDKLLKVLEESVKVLQILFNYATMPCCEIISLIDVLQLQMYKLYGNRVEIPQISKNEK